MVHENFKELSNIFSGFRLMERSTEKKYACALDGGAFYRKYKKDTLMFGHKSLGWKTSHGIKHPRQPHFMTSVTVNKKSTGEYVVLILQSYQHPDHPYRFICKTIKEVINVLTNEWLFKEVSDNVKNSYKKYSGNKIINHQIKNPHIVNIFDVCVHNSWVSNYSENSGWYVEWKKWRDSLNGPAYYATVPEKFILKPY